MVSVTTWAMLVSRGHTVTGAMLIWVAFTATWGHGDHMSESVVLLQLRSVLNSMAHVAKGHMEPGV